MKKVHAQVNVPKIVKEICIVYKKIKCVILPHIIVFIPVAFGKINARIKKNISFYLV